MNNFDQFIAMSVSKALEETLEENIFTDIADRAESAIDKSPAKLVAKLGGVRAKGKLNLLNMTDRLLNDFKYYLGEQQISYGQMAMEDLLEFVRTRVKFSIDPQKMIELCYKNVGLASEERSITALKTSLEAALGERKQDDALKILKDLIEFGKGQDGNAALALNSIWKLAREYPESKIFRQANGYIGRKISTSEAKQVLKKIAMILLKNSVRYGSGNNNSSSSSENKEQYAPIMNLLSVRSKKFKNDVLAAQLEKYGLNAVLAFKYSKEVSATAGDQAKLVAVTAKIDRLNRSDCINLSRILLSCFEIVLHMNILDHYFFAPYNNNGSNDFKNDIVKAMRLTRREIDIPVQSDSEVKYYEIAPVNALLKRNVTSELSAAQMLALLLGCMNEI